MSEPSPEAKQAAENEDLLGETVMRAFCRGYDTATAKAREELVATQNEVIRLNGLLRVANTERRDAQLAHQQPSAPTADVEKIAQEAAHELHLQAYILEPSDNGLVNILSKYFAQVSAPLVAELHVMHKGFSALQDVVLGMISRVKEGGVNNKIKKEINDDAR